MLHPTNDPHVTNRIPRDELARLLGRARRGEGDRDEASGDEVAVADRAAVVVYRASIDAWLAARR